ncbi:MAG: endonuclease III [Rickettsiales bacterium]|jgi:endonuclease-3|nr:endonuclease III [Rickettsiales bacterium]
MTRIDKIFRILSRDYGDRGMTELSYTNPYTLLVAVMLSAQATDVGVNRATDNLFRFVKSPEEMLELGFEKLNEHIRTVNYHNSKARHIIAMSLKLVRNFNSTVPNNMDDLLSLDGVGRKTANIILNVVFGIPTVAVDTHVFRVSNRLAIVKADSVQEAEKQLLEVVPRKYLKQTNNMLVLFGRYVCRALKPKCGECVLRKYCPYTP